MDTDPQPRRSTRRRPRRKVAVTNRNLTSGSREQKFAANAADGQRSGINGSLSPVTDSSSKYSGEEPGHLRSVLRLAGVLIAPTTLITSLLYYFGRVSTAAQYSRFAVPQSGLRITTTDYVLQSANPMVGPLLTVTLLVGLGVLLHALLLHVFRRPGDRVLVLVPTVVGIVGALMLLQSARGPLLIFRPLWPYRSSIPFLYRAIGIVLIVYAVYLRYRLLTAVRRRSMWSSELTWALQALVAVAGLLAVFYVFVAVAQYAAAYGNNSADQIIGQLKSRPTVVIYSAKRLSIGANLAREESVGDDDAAYRYRYTGLRLLAWENSKYLLLPNEWVNNPITIVLPESDSIRVELAYTQA
jgi:hypothetical protein